MTRSHKSTLLCLAIVLLAGVLSAPLQGRALAQQTSSNLPEPIERQVKKLLEEAEEDLANGRLGGPGPDNAIARFHEVEALDPGNRSAYEGLRRIAAKALELAGDALSLGEHVQAAEFLEIAAQAGADPKEIAALRKKIKLDPGQKVTPPSLPAADSTAEPAPTTAPSQAPAPAPVAAGGPEYERLLNGERSIRKALEAFIDGSYEEARFNLEEARRLVPEDPGIARLEARLAALEGDNLRQAEQKLDKAVELLKDQKILEAEALIDEAAAVLGWGGRVAQLKNRIRDLKPGQTMGPLLTSGMTTAMGLQFNLIPAGRFIMGAGAEPLTRSDEMPQHEVVITKPFWMGITEVTQGQWTAVMGDNPSRFQDPKGLAPVEQVSLEEVAEFLKRLNASSPDYIFRLPTEAEWEYACRAGSDTQYYYGDDPKELIDYAWYVGCSGFQTNPVGQKKPNAWGLYDTLGNVWEICSDWYAPGYYGKSPKEDPQGPDQGEARVIRGGCFLDGPATLRVAHRDTYEQNLRTGLRLVAQEK